MMFCSDKARALCSDRDHCGTDVRGDFTADSWCGGFNAGVAAALETAIDLRPLIDALHALAGTLPELVKDPAFKAALASAAKRREPDDGT